MSNDNVVSLAAPAEVSDPCADLLRTGARRLIQAAVATEFEVKWTPIIEQLGSRIGSRNKVWSVTY